MPSLEASPTEGTGGMESGDLEAVFKGSGPPIWPSVTSPSLLDWLTLAGVRTRSELDDGVTSQVAIVMGGCGEPCPMLTLLMVGSILVGRNTFHICSLAVGRAARGGGAGGTFRGNSHRGAWDRRVRRWWCARALDYILIGWGFEGAEEAKAKQ